jgi:hypothetical protein
MALINNLIKKRFILNVLSFVTMKCQALQLVFGRRGRGWTQTRSTGASTDGGKYVFLSISAAPHLGHLGR